jgi:hypothetical protein
VKRGAEPGYLSKQMGVTESERHQETQSTQQAEMQKINNRKKFLHKIYSEIWSTTIYHRPLYLWLTITVAVENNDSAEVCPEFALNLAWNARSRQMLVAILEQTLW